MHASLCWIIEIEIQAEQLEWVYSEVKYASQHPPGCLWSGLFIIHCWNLPGNIWIHPIQLCLPFFYCTLVYNCPLPVDITEVHQKTKKSYPKYSSHSFFYYLISSSFVTEACHILIPFKQLIYKKHVKEGLANLESTLIACIGTELVNPCVIKARLITDVCNKLWKKNTTWLLTTFHNFQSTT